MGNASPKLSLTCRESQQNGNPFLLNAPPKRVSGPLHFQYRETSTKCNNSAPVDDKKVDDKLQRFPDKSSRGSKEKRLSFLSAGRHDICEDAYNVSAVLTIWNVAVQNQVHFISDNNADEFEGKKKLREDSDARIDKL